MTLHAVDRDTAPDQTVRPWVMREFRKHTGSALAGVFGLGAGPIPRLGMPGIALGQVLAYAGGTLVLGWYLYSGKARIRLRLRGATWQPALARDLLQLGAKACASPVQTIGTMMILTWLVARCSTRLHHIVRQAPFARATLADEDVSVDFAAVTTPRDRVAVVATVPLTKDERWIAATPGTTWVFRKGRLAATFGD